jgi:catechol 1,2-dioxygenase
MSDLSIPDLLAKVQTDRLAPEAGSERVRTLVNRITADLFRTIEELDVRPDEFWAAADWLSRLGASGQVGLITAGLGLDRLLDLLEDRRDRAAGRPAGTPRAIEGPLYVAGAPVSTYQARLDDEADPGQTLVMHGTVRDAQGRSLAGASIDVWHANEHGRYSHFDPAQTDYHLRRRIVTDAQGRYRFRTKLPPGYAIPPSGPTAELFAALGRHGNRPAHVHFLVSAEGQRTLTTQINLPGDPFLDDDFAYATRDELVVSVEPVDQAAPDLAALGVAGPYLSSRFDFVLQPAQAADETNHLGRVQRALA